MVTTFSNFLPERYFSYSFREVVLRFRIWDCLRAWTRVFLRVDFFRSSCITLPIVRALTPNIFAMFTREGGFSFLVKLSIFLVTCLVLAGRGCDFRGGGSPAAAAILLNPTFFSTFKTYVLPTVNPFAASFFTICLLDNPSLENALTSASHSGGRWGGAF